jgi:hypothetical protein
MSLGRNDVNLRIGATDRTGTAFRSAESRMKRLAGSAKAMAGMLGIGVGIATLTRMTMSAIEYGSALTDASIATNTNIEALQVMRYAAQQAGADEKKLEMALVKANKAAVDASNGLTTYGRAFDYLNINTHNFIALPSEQKMITLANAMQQSTDKNRAAAAVMDIIGTRNAPKLMEVLQDLAGDGYDQLKKAAKEAGQVMDEDTAKKLDAAADAIERFKKAATIKTGEALTSMGDIWKGIATLFGKGVDSGLISEMLTLNPAAQAMLEKYYETLAEGDRVAQQEQKKTTDAVKVTAEEYSRFEKILWSIPDAIMFGNIAAQEGLEAYRAVGDVGTRTTDALRDRVVSASDDMADAFMTWAQTGKMAFSDMANSIIQDMVRIMVQQQITAPLATGFGNFLFGTKGSTDGGGSAGFFASMGSSLFGGAKAAGGPVYSGRSYLVGEKGPEIMTTRSSGTVIPNEAIGGGSTVINFNVTAIDSASFSQHLARHRAEISGIVEGAYNRRGRKGPLTT